MLSTLKLTSRTILGKEQSKKVKTILQSLLDNNDSYDFRFPVDWKAMNLLDYCFIIKNPMDLGTVNQKIREDRYETVQAVLDDIQLIWDNCKTYNPQGTWIHDTAQKLERSFKKMVKNYLPSISIVVPGRNTGTSKDDKKPSQANLFEEDEKQQINYHQQMKFYEKLKHLSPEEVGRVVADIISKCPSAFRETDDDNAQLIVDSMDLRTFKQACILVDCLIEEVQDRLMKKMKLQ